jgi:hypothetical protein
LFSFKLKDYLYKGYDTCEKATPLVGPEGNVAGLAYLVPNPLPDQG